MATAFVSTNDERIRFADLSLPEEPLSAQKQVMDMFFEMRTPVLRHLLWLNLQPDQAEDVVQETFLRLHLHLMRADSPQHNLRGWVWRVAHNLGVNARVASNRTVQGKELAIDDVSRWLADTRPNPEQVMQQQQNQQRIEVGIQSLNEREKQCVHLRAQGLGYRQIASALGIGRSTVADTMSRVTVLLRSYTHRARSN